MWMVIRKQSVSFRTKVRDQRSDRCLSTTHLCHLSLNPTSLQGGHSFLGSGRTVKVNKTVTWNAKQTSCLSHYCTIMRRGKEWLHLVSGAGNKKWKPWRPDGSQERQGSRHPPQVAFPGVYHGRVSFPSKERPSFSPFQICFSGVLYLLTKMTSKLPTKVNRKKKKINFREIAFSMIW